MTYIPFVQGPRSHAGPVCGRCQHIGHPTVAVGRFRPEGPLGFTSASGPLRSTRAEAETDVCDGRLT